MELIVFDLDGTLLNRKAAISDYTRDTLAMLRQRGIAYTVATGRTLHATRDLIADHGFDLPQIYKNGVITWSPELQSYCDRHLLTQDEIRHVMEAFIAVDVTPFLFTLEPGDRHAVYHSPLMNDAERRLVDLFRKERGLPVLPLAQVPADADITKISALGQRSAIETVTALVEQEPGLVAYMGVAIEDDNLCWVDIHHSAGSKGDAVSRLKDELGLQRVICFGDSYNDLSMFARADECYAPDNAKAPIKAAATAVIGHHDEDGIARFLRERFQLDE